jgi:hypothetical protein
MSGKFLTVSGAPDAAVEKKARFQILLGASQQNETLSACNQ